MRFVKRYRRVTTTRALKPWTPVFTLDGHEVTTAFTGAGVGAGYRVASSAPEHPVALEDGGEANEQKITFFSPFEPSSLNRPVENPS